MALFETRVPLNPLVNRHVPDQKFKKMGDIFGVFGNYASCSDPYWYMMIYDNQNKLIWEVIFYQFN